MYNEILFSLEWETGVPMLGGSVVGDVDGEDLLQE